MNANVKPVMKPSDAERHARVDLAACHRPAAHFGLNEGIDNHLTMITPRVSVWRARWARTRCSR